MAEYKKATMATDKKQKVLGLQKGRILGAVLLSLIALLGLFLSIKLILYHFQPSRSDLLLYGFLGLIVLNYFILKTNRIALASNLFIVLSFGGMSVISFMDYGIRNPALISFLLIIMFSGLLLGKRASVILTILSILVIWGLAYLELSGLRSYQGTKVSSIGRDLSLFILLSQALVILFNRLQNKSMRQLSASRRNYKTLNTELKQQIENLETTNKELRIDKEKAEESNRQKNGLLSNLSHEIRTPMNGIMGFSELLISPSSTEAEKEEYNSILANSCTQLMSLVDDIINMSKIESGIIEIELQPINLNAFLQDIYFKHSVQVRNKNLDFKLEKALPDDNCIIKTDEVKLLQIISNLLKNAIKFTHAGSIRFGYRIQLDWIEFFVSDTGTGIRKSRQDELFKSYPQEDKEIAKKYGGTGLGLPISKAFIEKMGGRIWLESEEGKGTSFYFTTPFAIVEEQSKNTRAGNAVKPGPDTPRVMVVEDLKLNERLLIELLKKHELEILTAETGEKALECFEKSPDFDLILMDIKLPGMDGHETTRQIRRRDKHVPIIAHTAHSFSGDIEIALTAGCNDLISKPINQHTIDQIVKKYLEQ
ncbi:MAG: hypothetical protein CSA96_04750 [Bacteroidetes bacterium]|nr:MAG: hypothetical protein CSA96_04750 [Bacteroidota bacterium]